MRRILSALVAVERAASTLLLLGLFAAVMILVVGRYFGSPFPQASEVARYIYVWSAYLAAAAVASNEDHIGVTVIDRLVGERVQQAVRAGAHLVVFAACAVLMWGSVGFLLDTAVTPSYLSGIPYGWFYGIVYLSFGLIALHSLAHAVQRIRHAVSRPEADLAGSEHIEPLVTL